MKQITRRTLFVSVLTLCTILLLSSGAQAATYTVTTTADNGAGSLRAAVTTANSTAADDTINFSIPSNSPNCTASGICTIILTSGELTANSTATAGSLVITNTTGASKLLISGNNMSRVFSVSADGILTLDGVTITNGNVENGATGNSGGGITNNSGMLTILNSTVSGNKAGVGGGISNNGIGDPATLILNNSTVSGNTASINGGGIFTGNNGGSSILTMTNSTVSGNTAEGFVSGGIYNGGSIINLTGVTITNNSSTNTNCSVCAGGIFNGSGMVNLNNTIVAGNTVATAGASPDFAGAVSSTSSYNLIGNNQGTTGISDGVNGNQVGTPTRPIDARLAPLGNYGGQTQTHALLADSPAIDKGKNFDLITDQRGKPRPIDIASVPNAAGGDATDIGAFEVQESSVQPTSTGNNITVETSAGNISVTFLQVTNEGVTIFTPLNSPSSAGIPPSGYTILESEPAYNISTNAAYTPPVIVCFTVSSINSEAEFARVRILHGENDQLVDRTILAPDNPAPNFAARKVCARVNSLSPFIVAQTTAPTAASVIVSGRVLSVAGSGLAQARVTMTDQNGEIRSALTNSFGYYRFNDMRAGETYIVSVLSKRYSFAPRIVTVNEDISELNFTAQPFGAGKDISDSFVRLH